MGYNKEEVKKYKAMTDAELCTRLREGVDDDEYSYAEEDAAMEVAADRLEAMAAILSWLKK